MVYQTVSGTALIASSESAEASHCPITGTKGLAVKVDPTVGNHVREATWEHLVGVESLWFCPEPQCPVVYFDDERAHIWGVDDLRTRVGIKSVLDPIPVCYCRRVSRAQIAYELVERGCCDSVHDIKEFTGANTGELCVVTNPAGRCCGGHVRRVVDEIVASRAVAPTLADEAATTATEIPD